jgi:hypothetical protein
MTPALQPRFAVRAAPIALSFTLAAVALAGCGVSPDDPQGGEPTEQVSGAATGANPLVDVEYLSTITMQGSQVGVWYSDLAFWGGNMYALRSDGAAEVRTRPAPPLWSAPFKGYLSGGPWSAIKFVDTSTPHNWNVIGAKDSTHQILKNIGNVPALLGSYPAGVDHIVGIAGTEVPGTSDLKLFVLHPDGTPSGVKVLRMGTYSSTTRSIVWDATTQPWGSFYNNGFCYSGTSVYTVVSYMTSFVSWFTPPSTTGYEINLAPYTEHAYLNPGGFNDRWAPVALAFDTSDQYFYGIDVSVLDSTHHTWVYSRLAKSNLRP